jgi:hypothetical protein
MPKVLIDGVGKVNIEAEPGTDKFNKAIDEIRQAHGGFSQPKKAEPWVDPGAPGGGGPAAMMGGVGVTPGMMKGVEKAAKDSPVTKAGEAMVGVGKGITDSVANRPMTTAGQVAGSMLGPAGTAAGTFVGSLGDQIYKDPYNDKTSTFGKIKSAAAEGAITGVADKFLGVVAAAGKGVFGAVFGAGARRVEQTAAGESLALVEKGGSIADWFASKQAARSASYRSAESTMAREQADLLGIKLKATEKVGSPPTREDIATKKINGALRDAADLISQGKPSMQEASTGVKGTLENAKKAFHEQFTEDYKALDGVIEAKAPRSKTVGPNEVLKSKIGAFEMPGSGKVSEGTINGGSILKNFEEASRASRAVGMRDIAPNVYEAKPFEQKVMADMKELPAMSFEKAHQLRSDLLAKARGWEGGINSKENLEVADRAIKSIDQEMSRAAKSAGEDVYTAWRNLNSAYKDGKVIFESDLVTGLAAAKPEDLVASIAPGKMGMTDAKTIMDALAYNKATAAQSTREFQRVYAESILKGGDPFKMKERLEKIGGETLGTVFGRTPEATKFMAAMNANAQLLETIGQSKVKRDVMRDAVYGGHGVLGMIQRTTRIALDRHQDVMAALTVKIMEKEPLKREYFKALRDVASETGAGPGGAALITVFKKAFDYDGQNKKRTQ